MKKPTAENDRIPIVEIYRGIGLHDEQSPQRLDVVRRAVDAVYDESDYARLLKMAGDTCFPPEARLFAGAKLEAAFEIATNERRVRPPFELKDVWARNPGLDSKNWRCKRYYGSLLDPGPAPGENRPRREAPWGDP